MLRFAAFGLACVAVLYVCLAPTGSLPSVSVWDKAEHALTWGALTGFGFVLWPRRPWRVAAFTLLFGAATEALQATMGFGRRGDLADFVADAVGTGAALGAWALFRRRWGGVGDGT